MTLGGWKISQQDDGFWIGECGHRRTPKFPAYGMVKIYIRKIIAKENGVSKNLDKVYTS